MDQWGEIPVKKNRKSLSGTIATEQDFIREFEPLPLDAEATFFKPQSSESVLPKRRYKYSLNPPVLQHTIELRKFSKELESAIDQIEEYVDKVDEEYIEISQVPPFPEFPENYPFGNEYYKHPTSDNTNKNHIPNEMESIVLHHDMPSEMESIVLTQGIPNEMEPIVLPHEIPNEMESIVLPHDIPNEVESIVLPREAVRKMLMKSIAAIFCHAGYDAAPEGILHLLCDIVEKYFHGMLRLLRRNVDKQLLSENLDIMSLEEAFCGMGFGGLKEFQNCLTSMIQVHDRLLAKCENLHDEFKKYQLSEDESEGSVGLFCSEKTGREDMEENELNFDETSIKI